MTQTRWFCSTCKREWVHARHWLPQEGCPGCRSAAIQPVTYTPVFPGADIPRDSVQVIHVSSEPMVTQQPNLTLAAAGGLK